MYVIETVFRNWDDNIDSEYITRDNKILFFSSKEKAERYIFILGMMSEYVEELCQGEYCDGDGCFPLKFTRLCDPFPLGGSFVLNTLGFEVI